MPTTGKSTAGMAGLQPIGGILRNRNQKTQRLITESGPQVGRRDPHAGRAYHPDDNCPECHGAGFLHPLGIDEQPVYSQVVSCRCLVKARNAYLANGGMAVERGIRPEPQSFDDFVLLPGNREAFNAAREWAEGKSFLWLLIYGEHGCGKSHLCNAAVKRLGERGIMCYYRKPSDIHAEIRRAVQSGEGKDSVLDLYKRTMCLILDDYAIESGTPEQDANMEDILVTRFEWQAATMMTTNLMWSQLPGRIASRFDDRQLSRRIQNTAPDYRSQK